MQTEGKSKRKFAWRSTCLICKATLDFLYTIGVGLLAILVCAFAYIVNLDETSMPDVLVRLIEKKLKAQGATLSMSGIQIQPNGLITLYNPVVYSTDLQSEIARADQISLRVDPALLLFARARLTEFDIINGSLITPALLSRSGIPEPLIDQIDLRAENQRGSWSINQFKIRFGEARASTHGIVNLDDFDFQKAPEDTKPFSKQLVAFHKNASKIREALSQVSGLEARIVVDIPKNGPRSVHAVITALEGRWKDQALAKELAIEINVVLEDSVSIAAHVGSIAAPQNTFANDLELNIEWAHFPTQEDWYPRDLQFSIDSGGQHTESVTNLSLELSPYDESNWLANGFFHISDSSWRISSIANPDAKTAVVELVGSPTSGLVELATRIAKQVAPQMADQPLESIAVITDNPDVRLTATFEGALRPTSVDATLEATRLTSLGAPFDRVIAQAKLRGNSLEVPNLWLRSGKQNGRLSVSLDLETKRRRLLIDGLFNPNTVNGWIPELWWTELWGNFRFPDEGFYCLMDSSQIIKRPETLWLTGYATGKDLDIRGHPMKEIETRMFILQRYIDLYDLNLVRTEGSIDGEAQFSIAQDPRDERYKMTALWVDADSTIDLSIGPDLIYEVRENVEEILEPYGYLIPPRVVAKSSSTRHKDRFTYDIDLQIDTDNEFSYYHYPLDSLNATVSVGNGRADIPVVKARLAGGVIDANAVVRNEHIDLSVALSNAHFGNTLKASAAYFRANDPESSAHDIKSNELSDYGGLASFQFEGKGLVGDPLSYVGKGTYQISGAKLTDLPLLGGISRALDSAGLKIATLNFKDADGAFNVQERYVEFPELRLVGPIAQIKSSGRYDLKEDELDFKARLQPFRSVPLINFATFPIEIFTGIFEVSLTGPISNPKKSVFRGPSKREEPAPKPNGNGSE